MNVVEQLECHVHPSKPLKWRAEGDDGEYGWCPLCKDTVGYRHATRVDRLNATREKVANRKTVAPLPKQFSFRVVGVTFAPGYPQNVMLAEWAWATHAIEDGRFADINTPMGYGVDARLQRNPDNEHDSNAIEVHLPVADDAMLGHVPANLAARLAPLMDEGQTWVAWVKEVVVDYRHIDKPGIEIAVRRVG